MYSAPVQSGPGAHSDSCTVGTGSKPAAGGVNHSPTLIAKVKERVELYIHSPVGWMAGYGVNFTILLQLTGDSWCILCQWRSDGQFVSWHVNSTANLRNTEPFRQAAQHSTGVSCSEQFKVNYAVGWSLSSNKWKLSASKIILRVIWSRHARCSTPGTKICNFRVWQPASHDSGWTEWEFKRHESLLLSNGEEERCQNVSSFHTDSYEARCVSSFGVCIITSGFCSQRHKQFRRNVAFWLWKVP